MVEKLKRNETISLGFGISLSTLRKNKLRAVLTVTGTSVGIAMIIAILAVGNEVDALRYE
jgi:hypothetical protein